MSAAWDHNLICQVAQDVQKRVHLNLFRIGLMQIQGKIGVMARRDSIQVSLLFPVRPLHTTHNYLTSRLVLIAESFDACLLPAGMARDPTAFQLLLLSSETASSLPGQQSSHFSFSPDCRIIIWCCLLPHQAPQAERIGLVTLQTIFSEVFSNESLPGQYFISFRPDCRINRYCLMAHKTMRWQPHSQAARRWTRASHIKMDRCKVTERSVRWWEGIQLPFSHFVFLLNRILTFSRSILSSHLDLIAESIYVA